MSTVIDLASRRIKSKDDVKPLWEPQTISAKLTLPEVDGEELHYDCLIWRKEESGRWNWQVLTFLEPDDEHPCEIDQGEAPTMEEAQGAVLDFLKEQLYWL